MELFGRAEIEVVVYGGTLAPKSPDLVGEVGITRIRDFQIDLAIMGADALDAEHGEFYSADLATAMLSRAAQERAAETLVVLDGSKFGKRSLAVVGRLGRTGYGRHRRLRAGGGSRPLIGIRHPGHCGRGMKLHINRFSIRKGISNYGKIRSRKVRRGPE